MKCSELMKRILVACFGIPLIIFCAWYGRIPFLLLIDLIMIIGLLEFYHLTNMNKIGISQIVSAIIILSLSWLIYFRCKMQLVISIMFIQMVLLLIIELFIPKEETLHNVSLKFFGILYISLLNSFILIREYPNLFQLPYQIGGQLVILIFITIWISDSTAYLIGSQFGKHSLFKRVSPHKTLEGSLTGFIFALLTSLIIAHFMVDFTTLFDGLMIGSFIGILGQLSDLLESLFKRNAGIKDSSNLLPGHGGILDRFDSTLFAVPIIYSYLIIKF